MAFLLLLLFLVVVTRLFTLIGRERKRALRVRLNVERVRTALVLGQFGDVLQLRLLVLHPVLVARGLLLFLLFFLALVRLQLLPARLSILRSVQASVVARWRSAVAWSCSALLALLLLAHFVEGAFKLVFVDAKRHRTSCWQRLTAHVLATLCHTLFQLAVFSRLAHALHGCIDASFVNIVFLLVLVPFVVLLLRKIRLELKLILVLFKLVLLLRYPLALALHALLVPRYLVQIEASVARRDLRASQSALFLLLALDALVRRAARLLGNVLLDLRLEGALLQLLCLEHLLCARAPLLLVLGCGQNVEHCNFLRLVVLCEFSTVVVRNLHSSF